MTGKPLALEVTVRAAMPLRLGPRTAALETDTAEDQRTRGRIMSGRLSEVHIAIPQPPATRGRRGGFGGLWAGLGCFGPAAILSSMSVGAGETIVVVRTGAWAGYDLLWVVLVSCLVKGFFVTYMLGRYTAMSGESVGQRLVRLPGPRGWLLLAIIGTDVIFAPFAWVAIAKPCGNLVNHLAARDLLAAPAGAALGDSSTVWRENLYTTLFIALALLVSVTSSYKRLERQQIAICAVLVLGTLAGTLLVRPDLAAMARGLFARCGRLPGVIPPWAPEDARNFPLLNLATVFAYVGGSVTGYVAYASWVGLRRWGLTGHPEIESIRQRAAGAPRIDYLPLDAVQRRRLHRLVAPLRWDITLGTVVLFVVTVTFMAAGAAVLYERQSAFSSWRLLTDQAFIWRHVHPWLVPVYYVTVVAALWGTLVALPEIYARVAQEFFTAIWPHRRWDYHRLRWLIAGVVFAGSTVLIWTDLAFDTLTQVAGFLVANLAVAAVAVAGLYLDGKLPPGYRMHRLLFAGALFSAAILAAAAWLSGWGLLRKAWG